MRIVQMVVVKSCLLLFGLLVLFSCGGSKRTVTAEELEHMRLELEHYHRLTPQELKQRLPDLQKLSAEVDSLKPEMVDDTLMQQHIRELQRLNRKVMGFTL